MKKELIFKLMVFTALVSIGGSFLLALFQVDMNAYLFFSIPLFLALYELVVILCSDKYMCVNSHKSNQFLFYTKLFKVLLSVLFVLVCYLIEGLNTAFLIVFLIYYIVFLLFESWVFIRCNKEFLRKMKQHE